MNIRAQKVPNYLVVSTPVHAPLHLVSRDPQFRQVTLPCQRVDWHRIDNDAVHVKNKRQAGGQTNPSLLGNFLQMTYSSEHNTEASQ